MKKISLTQLNQILPAVVRYLSHEKGKSHRQIANDLELSRAIVMRYLDGANDTGNDMTAVRKLFGDEEFNIEVPTIIYKYMTESNKLINRLEANPSFRLLRDYIISEVAKRGLYPESNDHKVRDTQQYVSFNFYYEPSSGKLDINRQVLFVRYSKTEELILEFHCPNSIFREMNQGYFEFIEGKKKDDLQKKLMHQWEEEGWYPKVRVKSLTEEDGERIATYTLQIFDFLDKLYGDNN